ncbi:MAG TPA: tetratricopeptide repeat protein [Xanthomonadales bacterium]|nr:tetratricopeptide repeat protein [Xanthomonadales bacterium]
MATKVKVSKAPKVSNVSKAPNTQNRINGPRTSFFPKIYRFITERWKLIVAGVISGAIIIGIILQNVNLYHNIREQQAIRAKRGAVEKELSFWKKQSAKYKDARDIYFRIAALEYELGDKEGAKEDLQKALEIDPNFKEGREMEKMIGI